MALDNILRLSVVGQWNAAAEIVNVFHYRPTLNNLTPSPQNLAELWESNLMATYLGLISSANAVQKVVVIPAVGNGAGYEIPINLNGTAAGDSVAAQVAPIISWKTAKRGKSYRGRTYLPPCSEAAINGNLFATFIDAATAFAEQAMVLESLTIPFYQLVIAS